MSSLAAKAISDIIHFFGHERADTFEIGGFLETETPKQFSGDFQSKNIPGQAN